MQDPEVVKTKRHVRCDWPGCEVRFEWKAGQSYPNFCEEHKVEAKRAYAGFMQDYFLLARKWNVMIENCGCCQRFGWPVIVAVNEIQAEEDDWKKND